MPRKKRSENPLPTQEPTGVEPAPVESLPAPTDFYQLAIDDTRRRLITRALEVTSDIHEAAALYHTDPAAFAADAKRLGIEQPEALQEEPNGDWRSDPDAEAELLDRSREAEWDDDSGDAEFAGDESFDY